MLSPALRQVLVDGPNPADKTQGMVRVGGAAHVRVQWGKHRDELVAEAPPGHRPWAFWRYEIGLAVTPNPHRQLKLILEHGLARSDAEAAFVEQRLRDLTQHLRTRQNPFRAVA